MSIQAITDIIKASIDVKQQLLSDEILVNQIATVTEVITKAFKNGNAVYFAGNGGSAADAQHLAAEFSGRFYKDRKALPSDALHCNSLAKPGDVLVGISTSGNSGNIVKAFEMAKTIGVTTIGFTGQKGGKMKDLGDYLINVPSNTTPRIQESHILVGHIICELVEINIFGN